MARSRRPPRRQGVVYGPIQVQDRGYEASSLIGRILGMLVVAAAVGVLVVFSLTFMGGGGSPRASSTATAIARASLGTLPPIPSIAPTVRPAPTARSTAVPSAAASVAATPFQLEVRVGPGFVTFGTLNDPSLRITDPRTSFGLEERIAWSANLSEPASSISMSIEIHKRDRQSEAEELVRQDEVRPVVTSAQIFLRRLRPSNVLDGPGIYVVRYLRGEEVMAEGHFEVRAP